LELSSTTDLSLLNLHRCGDGMREIKSGSPSVHYFKIYLLFFLVELAIGIYEMMNHIYLISALPFPTHWIPEVLSLYYLGFWFSTKETHRNAVFYKWELLLLLITCFIVSTIYELTIFIELPTAIFLSSIFILPLVLGTRIERWRFTLLN